MDIVEFYLRELLSRALFVRDEQMEVLIEDLREILLDFIITKVVSYLSYEDLTHLNKMIMNNSSSSEIISFLNDRIDDLNSKIEIILEDFEKQYLSAF